MRRRREDDLIDRWLSTPLANAGPAYLERLYADYLRDPDRVDPRWRHYLEAIVDGRPPPSPAGAPLPRPGVPGSAVDRRRRPRSAGDREVAVPAGLRDEASQRRQLAISQLIAAYRELGHLEADIDPLGLREPARLPELRPEHYGLGEDDLDRVCDTQGIGGRRHSTLRDLLASLRRIYCGPIGAEYMYIPDREEKRWLQQRLEVGYPCWRPEDERRREFLRRLIAAEALERYLHSRYVGQKRFSLEGAESLVLILDSLISRGPEQAVREVAIGMAHRGRLNVLVNIMGKSPAELFLEFEGKVSDIQGSGDVKYHQGFSSNIETPHGVVHLALAFNPSHLEIVSPVVEGSVRARQARRKDADGSQVIPVLIHGDAAFSGQGVVMETINMSKSRGYSTKGTVHIVVDNQIGFTTSNERDARSSVYCSDIAKMVNAPVFHVNADAPEAVAFVASLALDYRMRYRKDVVIDLVCYRRHGHSEADEPSVTQPMMYKRIRSLPTVRERYAARLREQGLIDDGWVDRFLEGYRQSLDKGECVAPHLISATPAWDTGGWRWRSYHGEIPMGIVRTGIAIDKIRSLWDRLLRLPEGFELHRSVARIYEDRRRMAAGGLPVDWGFAEILAYASLLDEGYPVRLSGQDSARGAFFHRHATVYNMRDGEVYVPLRHLADDQPEFIVTNSLLSEEAVLAFEYGYATTDPTTLVIWEAQFGDFANNAQVVIDQFISAGEQKWNRLCGLVLFLPHGYEGQGPEHSSARLERYLQLCAEHNMQVCIPTTPAQMFHMLRRQIHNDCRKPLIALTPKSLLRHKLSVSRLDDLTSGGFRLLIPEVDEIDPGRVRRVVLCAGKVYFDLLEKRRNDGRDTIAIVRIEQLYPFPEDELAAELGRYPDAHEIVWCQEEPMNQGAWYATQHHIRALLRDDDRLRYAGRPASAAPAVGYPLLHIRQLCELLEEALVRPFDEDGAEGDDAERCA